MLQKTKCKIILFMVDFSSPEIKQKIPASVKRKSMSFSLRQIKDSESKLDKNTATGLALFSNTIGKKIGHDEVKNLYIKNGSILKIKSRTKISS